jgi:hypothetical protein
MIIKIMLLSPSGRRPANWRKYFIINSLIYLFLEFDLESNTITIITLNLNQSVAVCIQPAMTRSRPLPSDSRVFAISDSIATCASRPLRYNSQRGVPW